MDMPQSPYEEKYPKRPSTMARDPSQYNSRIRKYRFFDSSEVARLAAPEVCGQVKRVAKKSDCQMILFIPV